MIDTAIVGAGLAGLTCARHLADAGASVRLLEKARGPGGRMSTRRTGDPERPLAFDHGAQYFTARDPAFRAEAAGWVDAGVAAPWEGLRGRIRVLEGGRVREAEGNTERLVGVPAMNAIPRHLARGLPVQPDTRVTRLVRAGHAWVPWSHRDEPLGRYARIVLAVPAPQAAEILATVTDPSPELARVAARVAAVPMAPCWAVLLAFSQPLGDDLAPFDGAFVHGSPLAWVARSSAKPGRPDPGDGGPDCWVLHAGPDWSRRHLDEEPDRVAALLREALAEALGIQTERLPVADLYARAHRWRFALPEEPLDVPFLLAAGDGLAVCGDWCGGPRVEGAWLSGRALGRALLGDGTPAP